MVLVELTLVSARDGSRRSLGVIRICNTTESRNSNVGHYSVELLGFNGRTVWRRGVVRDFPRQNTHLGAYDLLYRALHSAVGDRNRGGPPQPELTPDERRDAIVEAALKFRAATLRPRDNTPIEQQVVTDPKQAGVAIRELVAAVDAFNDSSGHR